MKKSCFSIVFILFAVGMLFAATSARAQPQFTFVSASGQDTNPCTFTAPCRTFNDTLAKTATGGTITCLGDVFLFPTLIAKSITINCENGTIQTAPGAAHIVIDSATNAKVVLRGLHIDGSSPSATAALTGIRFVNGAALHVENCTIRDFNATGPNGNGIVFAPSAGTAKLFVNNTQITDNGVSGVSGNGIFVAPTGSAGARVFVTNSTINNNDVGLRAEITATTGTVDISIMNVAFDGNRIGVSVNGDASGSLQANITRSMIAGNVVGLNAFSPAIVRVGDSVVTANTIGVSGNVFTFGNNQMAGNNTLGSPSAVGLQGLP